MKEVTFRTDFPHAVKSQAQKQLRETYLCLEGGGVSGREEGRGKREIKGGGNFRKKCFPKKWFGTSHSRGSAPVPVKGEQKQLCWVVAVFFWMVSISPSSSFSLVNLCSSCYYTIKISSSFIATSIMVCIPDLSSLRDGPFAFLLLLPLLEAAGSPSKHPCLHGMYFLNPRREIIAFKY